MTSHQFNKEALNNFVSGMLDIQLARNPYATEVIVIFNHAERDQYQDVILTEELRVKKLAIVKKDIDIDYVQQEELQLLEDDFSKQPWIVKLTKSGFPRIPKSEDQILIEGLRYNISYVKPLNRDLDNTLLLTIYPDRNDVDALAIYKVTELEDDYIDIVYGGNPVSYSFSEGALYDESLRSKFTSRPRKPSGSGQVLYLFDDLNNVAKISL